MNTNDEIVLSFLFVAVGHFKLNSHLGLLCRLLLGYFHVAFVVHYSAVRITSKNAKELKESLVVAYASPSL